MWILGDRGPLAICLEELFLNVILIHTMYVQLCIYDLSKVIIN